MEILLLLAAWPFLVLVIGLLFISGFDAMFGGYGLYDGDFVWPVVGLLVVYLIFRSLTSKKEQHAAPLPPEVQAAEQKKAMYVVSIAGLMPLFVKYLLDTFMGTLPATVLALVLAFGAVALGLMAKGNRVVAQGSMAGGIFTVILLYGRLWDLGEGARVVATGAGLAMAIGLAIVKFKDKLS